MKSIEVNEYDFSTREQIHSQGMESTRYLRDNTIYKFLIEKCRYNRDIILRALHSDRVKNTPTPLELLTTNGEFVGYTMPNLDEYYLVSDYLYFSDYDYNLRRKACLDLVVSLNDLMSKGYEHYDLHSKNVMVRDGSARIIDVDSMCNPSLGVSLSNSSYSTSHLEGTDIVSEMKKNLVLIISRLLLTPKDFLEGSFEKVPVLREFYTDEVMKSFLLGKSTRLIDEGYSVEDVLASITEEKANKYFELRRR